MDAYLPTMTGASWTVTSLYDSLRENLAADSAGKNLFIFAYAVTASGWRELQPTITTWLKAQPERSVTAYVGTDHGLTEPDALRTMRNDRIIVRIMRKYNGVYHPKVFWLIGGSSQMVWIGSNNLTRDGLLNNIEFASLIQSFEANSSLEKWYRNVDAASEILEDKLLKSYESERRTFGEKRSGAGTFTWSKREGPPPATKPIGPATLRKKNSTIIPRKGDLIVEVMVRETSDGSQMQFPKPAAISFFGLRDKINDSRKIIVSPVGTPENRILTITLFKNRTTRLSINELDYRSRPCVIVFRRLGKRKFVFEIVQKSIFPGKYRSLLEKCEHQTRKDSRRWTLV